MVTNKNNMRQVLSVGSCDNVYIRGDMHGAKDDLSLGFNGCQLLPMSCICIAYYVVSCILVNRGSLMKLHVYNKNRKLTI